MTERFAYSTITLSAEAIYLRCTTSALYPTLRETALAAENNAPPEHHVSWTGDVDLPEGWEIGYEMDNGGPDTLPYMRPTVVHPGSATSEDVRRVWRRYIEVRTTRSILADVNLYRSTQGLDPRPLPSFVDLDQRNTTDEISGYRGRT